MTEKIEINATLVFEIRNKNHWVNSFPGALPKLPMSEKFIWVDRQGNTATCGEDFIDAEKLETYPIKIYWLSRTSHTNNPDYVQKIKELF